jgi:alpha-beta hydrolase superfamily lysophospholipase
MTEVTPQIEGSTQTPKEGGLTRTQEKALPEKDLTSAFDRLFYAATFITRKSMAEHKAGIERTRQLRRVRAKLYKELKKIPHDQKESRQAIFDEAHARDNIEAQFLNQGNVEVTLPNLGTQSSRFTVVELPESQKPPEAIGLPPIVFIPGISNDTAYGISLVEELALKGRKVITLGYPESSLGNLTGEFAKASAGSKTYEPHTTYFKEAIGKLTGAGPIEIWGHSTGSAIAGNLLVDPQFASRVENAVLLSPASSVDQSALSLNIGIARDFMAIKRDLPEFSKFAFIPQGGKDLKKVVYKTMLEHVRTKFDYTTSHVKEGGKIIVISGPNDKVVKSSDAKEDFERNPQIIFREMPNAYHSTPTLKPEATINLVQQTMAA